MTPVVFRRAATEEDWRQIREICCLTGNDGNPIAHERWAFFAEQWVAPYRHDSASVTWVVCEAEKVLGYVNGCANTRNFEKRKRKWNLLFRLLFTRQFVRNNDTRRFVRRTLGFDRWPEEHFAKDIREILLNRYPAHLHINLRESARGTGYGKLLLEKLFTDLREAQATGVHLFCGQTPLPFYLRMGFEELARIEFRPNVWVYALVRML